MIAYNTIVIFLEKKMENINETIELNDSTEMINTGVIQLSGTVEVIEPNPIQVINNFMSNKLM